MNGHLTDPERNLLLEVLKDRLGSLRQQVYYSMIYQFKPELKHKQEVLRGLIERMESAGPAGGGEILSQEQLIAGENDFGRG